MKVFTSSESQYFLLLLSMAASYVHKKIYMWFYLFICKQKLTGTS